MERNTVLEAVRRRWWVVLALGLLGFAAGAVPAPGSAADASTTWRASHTLLLNEVSITSADSAANGSSTFSQLVLFATTGEVPVRVAAAIGYTGPPSALASTVRIDVDSQTGAIRITSVQPTAADAVIVADAFADELVKYLAERQDALRASRLESTLTRLDELETQVTELESKATRNPTDEVVAAQLAAVSRQYSVVFEQYNDLQGTSSDPQLTTLERATAFEVKDSGLSAPTSRVGRGLLAAAAGLVLGLGAALVLTRTDRKIRSRAQAEAVFGLTSQVAIPKVSATTSQGVVVVGYRHDAFSDAYRTLRNVVGFIEAGNADDGPPKAPITLVVSPGPGDGKTSISANLAAAFAETGLKTVVVNADFRRATLSPRILGKPMPPLDMTMTEMAAAPIDLLLLPTGVNNLELLDLAGTKAPPGELARLTGTLLPQLREQREAIVVDTSPVGATAEVLELVPYADVIVIAARIGQTDVDAATRTIDILRVLTPVPLVLTVVGDGHRGGAAYYDYSPHAERESRRSSRESG